MGNKISAAAARPTSSVFAGKQTATLKTMVTDELREDFERYARVRGYGSASDCLRELVLVAVHGPQLLADLHKKRIDSLVVFQAGIVPAEGS